MHVRCREKSIAYRALIVGVQKGRLKRTPKKTSKRDQRIHIEYGDMQKDTVWILGIKSGLYKIKERKKNKEGISKICAV